MTQYSNPDLTQREIVEYSLQAVVAMLAAIDATADAANEHGVEPIDYMTAQIIAQHVSILRGSKFALENERVRLFNIIATWDGEPLESTGTPTLPMTGG